MTLTEDEVRKINLIEILREDAEEQGRDIPEIPAEAPRQWTEHQIRQFFASNGTSPVPPTGAATMMYPAPSEEAFKLWFPGLPLSRTAVQNPQYRVLCFPNAGNAEDMYTSEGTGVRKAQSPLLEWCRSNQAECLAIQYPGRGMRLKEQPITNAGEMAKALFPIVASRLSDVPYIVIAHSVGTWLAYEFLCLAKNRGLPLPLKIFISAMPSPDIPSDQRPWRQQRTLDEKEFIEECRGWDISEVVFSAAMWPTYHSLLRSDFTLFDEYVVSEQTETFEGVPMVAFWGTEDRRVKKHHVEGWKKFFPHGEAMDLRVVKGNHLWPLDRGAKAVWLQEVVDVLKKDL